MTTTINNSKRVYNKINYFFPFFPPGVSGRCVMVKNFFLSAGLRI